MSTLKSKINRHRKKSLKLLTRNIGGNFTGKPGPIDYERIRRILVIRPNHRLGNQLLMTPLVFELGDTFPNARIDLFAGKVAPVLFRNFERVDRIIRIPRKPFKELVAYVKAWLLLRSRRYDLVVNVDKGSSSGRLATSFARSTYKLHGQTISELQDRFPDYAHLAKNPVYNLRHALAERGMSVSYENLPCMNLLLDETEKAQGKKLIEEILPGNKKTIVSLYTFATGAKCYTADWWIPFYEALVKRFPNCVFLEILPVENVSMIDFRAPSLYSKDVREMAAVMAHTAVYIGADCGVMHLASAAPIPTFGLFSVTNPVMYQPYNPGSKAFVTTRLKQEDLFLELEHLLNQTIPN
jgi:ADP-heptose:LPS heptosyltransferase